MKHTRLLPLIVPVLSLIFLEIFFFFPKTVYIMTFLIIVSLFYAAFNFCQKSDIDKKWWNFLALPAVLSIAVIAYSILLYNKLFIQTLFFAYTILTYEYLKYIYYYLARPISYDVFSIENISSYVDFFAFYLLAASIYGFQSIINLKIWLLAIFMLALSAVIIYQTMWAYKIDLKKSAVYIFAATLIISEIFWTVSFLPLNHNVAGLALALCYYILIGLMKHFLLEDKLEKSKVKLYLYFGFASILIILATAKWL